MKKSLLILILITAHVLCESQTHEYLFNNNLNENSGGPALTELLSCSAAAGSFGVQTSGTTSGDCLTFNSFCFNKGGGVQYPNPSIVSGSYTIYLFFRFSTLGGYARVIDFSNSAADAGIYFLNNCLNLYPNGNVGTCPYFNTNTYYLITFVRDGSTNIISVYVDGTLFGTYNDTGNIYRPPTASSPINFFRDDNSVPCETQPGCVKYISVSPAVSTASDVANTWANIGTITQSANAAPPTVTIAAHGNFTCTNNAVTLTASSAGTMVWNGGSLVNAANPAAISAPGTYIVTATDTHGCMDTAMVTVVTNTAVPAVSASKSGNLNCTTSSVTLTGSSPGNTMVWNGGALTNASNPAAITTAGTYTVTATDAVNGCTDTASVIVTSNNSQPPVITVNSAAICAGQTAVLTAAGGTSYSWSTSAVTNPISVSPPGTVSYTVTGTTGGCSGTAIATVTVNPLPIVTVTPPTGSACANSTLILTAAGANTYSWAPAFGLNAVTGASVSASPTGNTTYTVTGTDNAGCVNTAAAVLTSHPKPAVLIKAPLNPLCDSTKLNWASWSSVNGTTGTGIISSNLSVLVTKPSGGLSTTAGMFAGSVFPVQYNVPVNQTAIRNDLAGLFTFCFNRPVNNPQIALSSIGNGGLSVPVVTSAPYHIIWAGQGMTYPNDTTFVGREGYTIIQFPGAHTCISFNYLQSETYCNLAFGTLDTNCQTMVSPPICAGLADTLTATGAAAYVWHPAAGLNASTGAVVVASPLATTKYYVIGTDVYGCSNTDSVLITVIPKPIASITGDTVICAGDSITLTAHGHGSCLWNPGNFTDSVIRIIPASPALYKAVLTNTAGCKDSAAVHVVVNPLPHALFNVPPVCKNSPTTYLDASTGTIALWSWKYGDGGSAVIQNPLHTYASCDTFSVQLNVTTNKGCKDSIRKTAKVYCLPVAGFSAADVCLNQVMHFTDLSIVSGDTVSAWSWNFGDNSTLGSIKNPVHTYSAAGHYTVTLTASTNHGCKDTIIKTVTVHALPAAHFSSINVCQGGTASFTDHSTIATSDTIHTWLWTFGDAGTPANSQNTSHLYGASGTYTVQLNLVSNFGCLDSIAETAIVNPNPIVHFTAVDTIGCEQLCVSFQDLSSVSPGTILQRTWNLGDGSAASHSTNFDHCYTDDSIFSPAHYTVSLTVTSDSGCVITHSKNNYITVYPNPKAVFTVDPHAAALTNPVISITDLSIGTIIWKWHFGDTSSVFSSANPPPHSYTDTGTYVITLLASTQYGCKDSTYQSVTIEPEFLFYIPSAFTPNGDLYNNTFSGRGVFIETYQMMIFDRWGNLIYFTDDINKPWDGTANHGADIAQQDTYIYTIDLTDIKKKKHSYKGIVTLIK